ncbi:PRC-barrel domain-containing protein [Streptomyces sp. NPDC000594]|uniref:PRC-barrel domain-containing protein n=1 Tax=Streptomyces sp. NPDC000594 TaxID=3154261 RepID=UPI0033335ECA
MERNSWNYPDTAGHLAGSDLIGFSVEAVDGGIGKVDKHSDEVDSACLVVDTGPWIFGKQVIIPAGAVVRVDPDDRKVQVDLTKDQIKGAPEFHGDGHYGDADYHHRLGAYYWPPL